jgi:uncharacterized protein (DUF2336 family)
MSMTASADTLSRKLVGELKDTLSRGGLPRQAETVRRITDLFLANSAAYSDDQIALFDDIYAILVQKIEASAKMLLAKRLASNPKAPPRIVHALAFDDLAAVAAPVLTRSERLDDDALVANANTKSPQHLLAISKRKRLSSRITDVLMMRGDKAVIHSTACNHGAEFSDFGFTRLVAESEGDDNLAIYVGLRPNIPRQHFLTLLAKASGSVREKLQATNPHAADEIGHAVGAVTTQARKATIVESFEVAAARRMVQTLHRSRMLDESRIFSFATAGQFNECAAAISILADIPHVAVEAMMSELPAEGLISAAKVLNLSWPTVQAILDMMGRTVLPANSDVQFTKLSYERLKLVTAQKLIRARRMS